MTFKRNTITRRDTYGMPRHLRHKMMQQAQGRRHVTEGAHGGGPCPAVCLATLTGWSYHRAAAFLKAKANFTGAGMFMPDIIRAYSEVLGEIEVLTRPGGCVRDASRHFPPGMHGAIASPTHIMPFINGNILNAGPRHLNSVTTHILILKDYEA